MSEILKEWASAGLTCKVWIERDGVYRGCVFSGSLPVRAAEFAQRGYSASDALEQIVESVECLAALEARPTRPFDTTRLPFTDVVLKLEPPGGVPDPFPITETVKLADDLFVVPRDWAAAKLITRACDPPGENPGLHVDLRAPLYMLVRTNPPRRPQHSWDPDQRLQMAIALSRLVRPTSIGTEYSGRIIGEVSGRFQFVPGAVRGDGTRAWTSDPEHDWLTAADLKQLAMLIEKWDASPLEKKSRLAQAFWYYQYAALTELVDIRWLFIATGIETLLSSGSHTATRDFTQRVVQIANLLEISDVSRKEASRMWGMRSSLVHGAKHGGLDPTDFAIYGLMERVLRELLRRAIADASFREVFASAASIEAAFPVTRPEPKTIHCPHCGKDFQPK